MREIKFRAFDKKGRFDMADVLIIDFHDKYVVVDEGWNKNPETGEEDCVANFDEIELMQFTGLKDKNGKEIYEGDIIDDQMYVKWCEKQGEFEAFLCLMDEDEYCMACNGDMYWFELVEDSKNYEVIGNIYENEDLLK